jgi:nucleoside-diphosphate-sugar epimerase
MVFPTTIHFLKPINLLGRSLWGSKNRAEEVCAEFSQEGMIVPIIRPKSFIGPERLGAFVLLYDWAQDGRGFPMIGNGKNRYQLLDVYDLCQAYICVQLFPIML